MKQIYTLLLFTLFAFPLHAQLQGDGFYRVQNVKTKRYISVIDNKGSIDKTSVNADLGAIQTIMYFDRVATDPGSVIYIKKVDSEYDLIAQGTSVYGIVGITVQIINKGNGIYQAYKSYGGFSRYLVDLNNTTREVARVLTSDNTQSGTQNWFILPISQEENRYLAVQPTIQKDGYYYQAYYASYGFSFVNPDDKAYYVSMVDQNVAVYKEVVDVVPPSTPVIIKGKSNVADEHKITPFLTTPATVSGNRLSGTYFCSSVEGHINRVPVDATIRVFGILSDGSLGFKKDADLEYVPRNTAYLKVAADAPDEIKLMNEAEYNAWKEQERLKTPVTVKAVNISRQYGDDNPAFTYVIEGELLGGAPVLSCEATAASPVGTYPIVVTKGDITNLTPELVNGTLTITPAPLKAKVGHYTREYGDENPAIGISFEGFKNGETDADLTTRPTISTEATVKSNVGIYAVKVQGAESPNYNITYENGSLTVTPATLTVTAQDVTRNYGDMNPSFNLLYSGWKNDDTPSVLSRVPTVQTDATVASHVGVYDLTVSGGESPNYTFVYENGRLTVTPATLTVQACDTTRIYGDENPAFEFVCSGWKNGDTSAALSRQPSVSTNATTLSHVGIYDLVVDGAESVDYTFSYLNGRFTIAPAPLTISTEAGFYQREEGQENPEITLKYEGFKNNETPEDLLSQAEFTVDADTASVPGYYEIVIFGAESSDYDIIYENGTLQVLEQNGVKDILVARRQTAYTLQGTRMPQRDGQPSNLRPGIYVIGGRKVVVK